VTFRDQFLRFRKTPLFRAFYLLLLSLVATMASLLGGFCSGLFIVPLTALIVPYWLGERNLRRHALNGFVIWILASLFLALILAASSPLVVASPPGDTALSSGIVTPFRGESGDSYNFTVTLTNASNLDPENFTLQLNVVSLFSGDSRTQNMSAVADDDLNTADGKVYYAIVSDFGSDIHEFRFVVKGKNGTLAQSSYGLGPFTAPYPTYVGLFFVLGFLQTFLVILFFFLLLSMWWLVRRSPRRPMPKPKTPETEEAATTEEKLAAASSYSCTNCGADVSEDDTKCPKCGATFD